MLKNATETKRLLRFPTGAARQLITFECALLAVRRPRVGNGNRLGQIATLGVNLVLIKETHRFVPSILCQEDLIPRGGQATRPRLGRPSWKSSECFDQGRQPRCVVPFDAQILGHRLGVSIAITGL